MEPHYPDWKARCAASFQEQGVMATFGVTPAMIAPGHVVLEMPVRDELTQQQGGLNAGVITTVLDSASGYAAFTLMPAEAEVLTVEFKTNFLLPAKGQLFALHGEVVEFWRTLMVTQGRAYAVDARRKTLIRTIQATMMVVTGRPELAT